MGSNISALIIEPILAASILALAVLAIMKQNDKDIDTAMWAAIGIIILIVTIMVLDFMSLF